MASIDALLAELDMSLNDFITGPSTDDGSQLPSMNSEELTAPDETSHDDDEDPYDLLDAYDDNEIELPTQQEASRKSPPQVPISQARNIETKSPILQSQPIATPDDLRYFRNDPSAVTVEPRARLKYITGTSPHELRRQRLQQKPQYYDPIMQSQSPPTRRPSASQVPTLMSRSLSNSEPYPGPPNTQIRLPSLKDNEGVRINSWTSETSGTDLSAFRRDSTSTMWTNRSDFPAGRFNDSDEVRLLREELAKAKMDLDDQKQLLADQQKVAARAQLPSLAKSPGETTKATLEGFPGTNMPMEPTKNLKQTDAVSVNSDKSSRSIGWFGRSKSQSKSLKSSGSSKQKVGNGSTLAVDAVKKPSKKGNAPPIMTYAVTFG